MSTSFEAADLKSDNPVTFSPDTNIYNAIHILLQRKASGATVLNERNEVVGILSELDCLKAIINQAYYHEGGSGTVKDFMTTDKLEFMDPHISIIDAAQTLLAHRYRRMPVIKNGKFAGQISTRSVLQAFSDSMMEHEKTEKESAFA